MFLGVLTPVPVVNGFEGEVHVEGGRVVGADYAVDVDGGGEGWGRGALVDYRDSGGVFVALGEVKSG